MIHTDFFQAYDKGQRHFCNLDFEYLEGFAGKDFSDVVFEQCFLYIDFRNSNLTNAQFVGCNLKEIDLRNANLTNALMKNCLVESAMFKGAVVANFRFIDNYYYGLTIGQTDFDEKLADQGSFLPNE